MPSEARLKFLKKLLFKGLKLPFWGLNFVEFWCWGLIFGGQGGQAPLDLPLGLKTETGNILLHFQNSKLSNRCWSIYGADITNFLTKAKCSKQFDIFDFALLNIYFTVLIV